MKLSFAEKALINNPIRALLQKEIEVPFLLGPQGSLRGKTVLEIGCGQGVLTEMLITRFLARRVVAFDADSKQLNRAHRRLFPKFHHKIELLLADGEFIPLKDRSVDTAVEIATLHHIPRWTRCIHEISRVLKNDGQFFFEEPTLSLVNNRFVKFFLKHNDEHGFTRDEFHHALETAGYVNIESVKPLGLFLFGHAMRV